MTVRYPRELRSESAADRELGPGADDGRSDDSARPAGQGRSRQGLPRHPHGECAALGVHLRRHPRPRHRLLRGRGAQGGCRQRDLSPGLLHFLERPVRVHGARGGEAEDRRAGDAAPHLPAALSQFPAPHRDVDRHAVGAVRARGRHPADVDARLQRFGRRGGGFHRVGRRRRGDGCRDADLPRPCLGEDPGRARERRKARHRQPISTAP